MMTREEAHGYLKISATHLLSTLIDDIFNDFEVWEHDLRVTIDHYTEQASIFKGALDRANEKITELEKPKTCDGCQWKPMTHLHHAYCRPCTRQVHLSDNYKPKSLS